MTYTLCAALCLMQFNNVEELSLQEMKDQTNIEDGEMRRTLQVGRDTEYLEKLPFFISVVGVWEGESADQDT